MSQTVYIAFRISTNQCCHQWCTHSSDILTNGGKISCSTPTAGTNVRFGSSPKTICYWNWLSTLFRDTEMILNWWSWYPIALCYPLHCVEWLTNVNSCTHIGYFLGDVHLLLLHLQSWDAEIASIAQNWASTCTFAHDANSARRVPGRWSIPYILYHTIPITCMFHILFWYAINNECRNIKKMLMNLLNF